MPPSQSRVELPALSGLTSTSNESAPLQKNEREDMEYENDFTDDDEGAVPVCACWRVCVCVVCPRAYAHEVYLSSLPPPPFAHTCAPTRNAHLGRCGGLPTPPLVHIRTPTANAHTPTHAGAECCLLLPSRTSAHAVPMHTPTHSRMHAHARRCADSFLLVPARASAHPPAARTHQLSPYSPITLTDAGAEGQRRV